MMIASAFDRKALHEVVFKDYYKWEKICEKMACQSQT
jgi:hypothetical protein